MRFNEISRQIDLGLNWLKIYAKGGEQNGVRNNNNR